MQLSFRFLPALLITVLGVSTLAADAGAQVLDDAWFKLKVSAKGYEVAGGTEVVSKASLKTTVYANLTWDEMNATYAFDVWTLGANDIWSITYSTSLEDPLGADPVIYTSVFIDAALADTDRIAGNVNLLITIKLQSDDVTLKSAKLKTIGGEAIAPSTSDGNEFRGSLSVSGKTVAEDKLPFIPT